MNSLKNILLSCFLLLHLVVGAQSLKISVDSIAVTGTTNDIEADAVAHVTNLTTRTITFTWHRIVNDLPVGWESSICDKNLCWLPTVTSKEVELAPGDSSILDVRFYPNGNAGTGNVQVLAFVNGDSINTVVSAKYTGIITQAVGFSTLTDNDNIKIYPNPVKDYILVRNLPANQISAIEVYNIFGRKILSFFNDNGSGDSGIRKFNVDDLSRGIYMIRVYDERMNVIHTKSISKE